MFVNKFLFAQTTILSVWECLRFRTQRVSCKPSFSFDLTDTSKTAIYAFIYSIQRYRKTTTEPFTFVIWKIISQSDHVWKALKMSNKKKTCESNFYQQLINCRRAWVVMVVVTLCSWPSRNSKASHQHHVMCD